MAGKLFVHVSLSAKRYVSLIFLNLFLQALTQNVSQPGEAAFYPEQTEHLSRSTLFWLHAQNQASSFITRSLKMSTFVSTFLRMFPYSEAEEHVVIKDMQPVDVTAVAFAC